MITKPSSFTRLKLAYRFYRDGFRGVSQQKATQPNGRVPFIWPAWRNNQPQWQLINYEAYANEGFSANSIIYSAIMYKARAGIIAPLRAYKGETDKPELLPVTHWLQKLCLRPNPHQSWAEFMALNIVYFNLSGNSYTALIRQGGQVTKMYLFRPDRVWIIPSPDRKQVIGFYYVPEGHSWGNGIPWLAEDVIHVKLPNPADPLDGMGYGLSPLSAAARSVDVDNSLTKFLQLFFKNGAMPNGILKYDIPLTDDEVSRARERWMEIYGGAENWIGPAVLDQGGSYERTGLTFEEMDVSKLDARNESRIVAPFGVPLTLIESRPDLVQSTYSNKQTDREMFWEDTMEPELIWFQSDYQYYLLGDSGEFVKFDLTNTPSYVKRQQSRIAELREGVKLGAVTKDEYRAELGLDPLALDEASASLETGQPSISGDKPSNLESVSGLNGAQIQAVLDVLGRLQANQLTPLVAIELLTSVGIAQERAQRIVQAMLSGSLETPQQVEASLSSNGNIDGNGKGFKWIGKN